MPVTIQQMAGHLRRRQELAQATADARALRLRSLLPEAKRLLIHEFGAQRVRLFGSLAAGGFHAASDVDLAVEGLAPEKHFEALGSLMRLFAGAVDLVRVEDASASLNERIAAEGQPL